MYTVTNMAKAEINGTVVSNHHEDKHLGGMDNSDATMSTTSSDGDVGATATTTVTETETTPTTNANANEIDGLKRKASVENSEPKAISDHTKYWEKQVDASSKQSDQEVIQSIDQLPYILDSPEGKEFVAKKKKLVASGVVPHDCNSLQEDVPDDSSLSLIGVDDDATFVKQLQSASATEVAAALKKSESCSTSSWRLEVLKTTLELKHTKLELKDTKLELKDTKLEAAPELKHTKLEAALLELKHTKLELKHTKLEAALELKHTKLEAALELKHTKFEAALELKHTKFEAALELKHTKLEAALAREVGSYIGRTSAQANKTSLGLLSLADLSQANAITSAQCTQVAAYRVEEKRLKRMEMEKHRHEEDKDVLARFAKPYQYRDDIVNSAQDLKEYSAEELNKEKKSIPDFMNLYKKCFEIASFLDDRESWFEKKSQLYKQCLDRTLDIFRKFAEKEYTAKDLLKAYENEEYSCITKFMIKLRIALRRKGEEGAATTILQSEFQNLGSTLVDESDWAILSGKNPEEFYRVCEKYVNKLIPRMLWLPGPTAQEDKGVQPLFEQMLRCIAADLPFASAVEHSIPPRHSPKKGHLTPKMGIAGSDERNCRYPDITIWTTGKHVVVMDDDFIRLTFELKPGQRIAKNPSQLFQECLNQGMSHSAKSLIQALNFGPGVAAHCTFVVATPVYIRVMKMCSVSPGTPASNVQLQWSQFFPLVSEEGFTRFYESDLTKKCGKMRFCKDVGILEKELNVDEHGMDPKFAFLAIQKLMTSSRQDLVGVNMINSNLIGCGTFGTIIGSTKGVVLKVSKIGRKHFLLKELSILSHLEQCQQSTDGADNVIKLEGYGEKEMDFGGTKIKMPCLQLSPQGQSAYNFTAEYLKGKTRIIAEGLKLGLSYIHSRGIVHNDLSFQNFILLENGRRAVIIDFGSAEPENTRMNEIVGTPNFSHRDPLTKKNWTSLKEYDQASLAYVIHVVHNGGTIPWTPIEGLRNDHLEKRDASTKEWVKETECLNDNMRYYLLTAINSSVSGTFPQPIKIDKVTSKTMSHNIIE